MTDSMTEVGLKIYRQIEDNGLCSVMRVMVCRVTDM